MVQPVDSGLVMSLSSRPFRSDCLEAIVWQKEVLQMETANQWRQCAQCRYIVAVEIPNGEPSSHFCGNEATKVWPSAIGWLDRDAPACSYFRDMGMKDRENVLVNIEIPVMRKR